MIFDVLSKANVSKEIMDIYRNKLSVTNSDQKRMIRAIERIMKQQEFYQTKSIPDSYFVASLTDFKYRTTRFYEKFGYYGLSNHDMKWLEDVFEGRLFDIGTLRYQIFPMNYASIERDTYDFLPLPASFKNNYPEGTLVLNMHVIKDADISLDKVIDSIIEAQDFFSTYFPELKFEAFITRTWLIHPGMVHVLSEKSKIVQFGKLFNIVASEKITYQVLERSFGTSDLETIEKLPKTTQLQKNIVQNLEKIGVSLGIIPFNEPKTSFELLFTSFPKEVQKRMREANIDSLNGLYEYETKTLLSLMDVPNESLSLFLKLMRIQHRGG